MTKVAKLRLPLITFCTLLFCTLAAMCAQPWHKKPADWTPQDVRHILTESPWAKQGSAKFPEIIYYDDSPGSAQADPNAAGVGSRAGMPLPGGKTGHWDGGVGRDPGHPPTLPLIIRWDSALPIRQALVRAGEADLSQARSAKDYVITIIGLWPGEKTKQKEDSDDSWGNLPPEVPTEHEKPARPGLGHMREELMATAKLLLRGQPSLTPEDVTMDEKTGAIHFFFPRSRPITLSDKEATITAQFGPMRVSEKFRLKDMAEEGKLEL